MTAVAALFGYENPALGFALMAIGAAMWLVIVAAWVRRGR